MGDMDPHDKLRPCHLEALNATALNYATLINKAVHAYYNFASRIHMGCVRACVMQHK